MTGPPGLPRGHAGAPLLLLAAVAVIFVLNARAVFNTANEMMISARMAAVPVEASGQIAFVAIDRESLTRLDVWPWSRETYAGLIRSLLDAGATEVFLDVDLSSRSRPEADAALAEALREAGGQVILPGFAQPPRRDQEFGPRSLPLPEFRESAWTASVVVRPDKDGIVRWFPYGTAVGDEVLPSVASLLSGEFGQADTEFRINYAIDPATIPSTSVMSVIEGEAQIDLDGRSVVIGAHALELRKPFAVPVHGILSGAQLNIVAAETLLQGLRLRSADPRVAIVVAALFSFGMSRARGETLPPLFLTLGLTAIAVEAVAFLAQAYAAIVLPTPVMHAVFLSASVIAAGRELDLRRLLLRNAHVAHTNTERILAQVIAESNDAIVVVDQNLRTVYLSSSACVLFGTSAAKGGHLRTVVPPEITAAVRSALASPGPASDTATRQRLTISHLGGKRHLEYVVTTSELTRIGAGDHFLGMDVVVCVTARDVTAEHEQRLALDRLARFDPLTGAPNRTEFLARLTEVETERGTACALIAFGLNRLQTINSTLGRHVGDACLTAVVRRIDGAGLGISPVARLDGDRFAVFLIGDADDARRAAEGIVGTFAEPFQVGDHSARFGLHLGVATSVIGEQAELMLGKAELALDESRRTAGAQVRVFETAAFARQARARRIERALGSAIDDAQMHVAYQPQVRLFDNAVIGAEALMRWTHPDLGTIPPDQFVGIAESSGYIEELGRWALRTACADATTWPAPLVLSVNVSPGQLHRGRLVTDVTDALRDTGLEPARLCLEITESVFVDDAAAVTSTLAALRDRGVGLSLDDFGSGFSSFGYLERLPIDAIKLDRMFARGLGANRFNEAVVWAVVSLCRELGLKLVCEGVETETECDVLRSIGCRAAQGYWFGRPMRLERFAAWMAETDGGYCHAARSRDMAS